MTDGERIQKWLEDYKFYQERREDYESRMMYLLEERKLDKSTYNYLKSKVDECERQMQSLREKIMIYGDY